MIKTKLTRTINDTDKCVEMIGNRFDLVLVAAQRTRELRRGSRPLVDNYNNSTSNVLALKEIEQGKIGIEYLKKLGNAHDRKSTRTNY
jgi:DNA-directed RNA polymerase subunit omega